MQQNGSGAREAGWASRARRKGKWGVAYAEAIEEYRNATSAPGTWQRAGIGREQRPVKGEAAC